MFWKKTDRQLNHNQIADNPPGIVIGRMLFANYLLMLIGLAAFAQTVTFRDPATHLFTAAVMLSYAFIYLLPVGLVLNLLLIASKSLKIVNYRIARSLLYIITIAILTLPHLVIQLDAVVYKMYGFHFNGFVWNLLTTRGGIESMGFDASAYRTTAVLLLAALAVEISLFVVCLYGDRLSAPGVRRMIHRTRTAVPYIAVILFAAQGIVFGLSSFQGKSEIMIAANAFPFYVPITFQGFLTGMEYKSARNTPLAAKGSEGLALNYPLATIELRPEGRRYNIVWLVAESWRADMLTDEIMPQTSRFARQAQNFTNHYSGGNGTRMGMFSMFYGLYGSYWPAFLREQRSPVLMDCLLGNHYQVELYSSARFSYPEFDKTIFSAIPAANLHECPSGEGWQRHRTNVAQMIKWLDSRDTTRPFMTFLFFESPHARYYFPPECEIRKNYLKEFNYATADVNRQIGSIFNRYINSCNHLDTQLGRLLGYLENSKLLDSTIVIITGDHGEEFMEKGRWGHNSSFVEEQIRVPLVIWVPGMQPALHTEMTSHLDLPATVLHQLGILNPASDYSMGIDLFSTEHRPYTVLADWNCLVYRDSQFKITLPIKASASFMAANSVTTAADQLVEEPAAVFNKNVARLTELLRQSGCFLKRGDR